MVNEWKPAEAEVARWRRAHSIVERERDQARESLREACKVAQSYMVDAYQATERAEAAEARTAPAVTVEQRNAVADHLWNAMVGSAKSVVRDVVAQAFAAAGIEAEQATDPLLDKAQEFAALADWELTDREAELLHTVAAHVLGQEVK